MTNYELFMLLGWGLLLGGLPMAGYYLYHYGRSLVQQRRELPFDPFTKSERRSLWEKELEFRVGCTALAGLGMVLCDWLAG